MKVNMSSFHYRIINYVMPHTSLPKSLCVYFWIFWWSLIMIIPTALTNFLQPLAKPTARMIQRSMNWEEANYKFYPKYTIRESGVDSTASLILWIVLVWMFVVINSLILLVLQSFIMTALTYIGLLVSAVTLITFVLIMLSVYKKQKYNEYRLSERHLNDRIIPAKSSNKIQNTKIFMGLAIVISAAIGVLVLTVEMYKAVKTKTCPIIEYMKE